MGIKLIVEVMDCAPDTLTSGERMALTVIAERANDGTRTAYQSKTWTLDTLARRVGVQRAGLRSIFQGLARKGLDVRVPVRFKGGAPIYAYEGTAMTLRIPPLPERGGCDPTTEDERGGHSITTDGPEVMPQHPRGVAVASERGGHSHPQSLSYPSEEPSSLSTASAGTSPPAPVAAFRERDDPATPTTPNFKSNDPRAFIAPHCDNPDLLDALVQEIHTAAGVRSLGFFIEARRNGTLPGLVADAREAIERRNAGPAFEPHPDEHDFEPSADGVPACARCQYPRPNARHRRQPARSAA